MYNSKPHQEHDLARLHQHMLDTRLAVLVSHGEQGLLATHLPVLVDTAEGEFGTVYAHLARANRQWQDLEQGGEALLVFPGADAYVSPSYYPSKADNPKVVPTWNYLAVHAYGPADVIHEAEPLLAIVSRLTDRHEQGRSEPWKVTDAPADYLDGMLRAIVGVRLPIARLQGARKLSQNRSEQDIAGVCESLSASTDQQDNQLAAHMRQL
ncbi:TPA: FMN-binding negative transcriptional regulator [Pseudomonas putida]|jgi:transcriptional regulator|uniref:FMN-binding negative transcriptional regulator n=1 Tax=Pseudomonas putida (strain GB-1) TaxID=76869 RepID=B0KR69_PSEPG|nr:MULTISPECIES: FMN-binding negative transcriptional regulator [Pseudomonas]ABZ01274.1 FMN-binding negative transcriptional regulator [Pseudomonas putida GB-1]APF01366.1 transcriptional regulator [Pseudomonas putida]MBP0710240.1 FMN-binding negative transcriptional regulator [Pseudomonas sp. T34]MCE1003337.1 FMN-binding negative transcriptional regulator [Pseudomonas sp. NMI1173_11]MCK2189687.1 FMN-binding negative transcriptional regulator [Pseudomonas sp. MB04B]